MLKDMLRKLSLIGGRIQPLDPAKFGDPLAVTIEWTPASRGGTNFRTHKLIEEESSRVEFKAAIGAKIFYAIFLLVGIGLATAMSLEPNTFKDISAESLVPFLMGLLFAMIGGLMFYFGTTPVVFDKQVGYFWKGRKSPQDVYDKSEIKKLAALGDIHAIQLVSEYVRGSKSSYYSYEINLVLNDGKRITVVDHGNLRRIRDDAGKLSQFLGKPVWDAI